jgi:hypothetical protein
MQDGGFVMQPSDWIALGALAISIFAMVIAFITSTKKYELTMAQRSELLAWHKETVTHLIRFREYIAAKVEFNKTDYLSQLSALIEQGRFFFPNIESKDGYGDKKPSAYRGLRDVTLDFLVYSFNIFRKDDAENYIYHLDHLQRLFTSRMFDILQPRKYNKLVNKFTAISLDKNVNADDFENSAPYLYEFYRPGRRKKTSATVAPPR